MVCQHLIFLFVFSCSSSLFLIDENQKESTPFITSNNDTIHSYEGKNMALYEVNKTLNFDLGKDQSVLALL